MSCEKGFHEKKIVEELYTSSFSELFVRPFQ